MTGVTRVGRARSATGATRVGYVLKRYPRYSETFIVNEILALERRGVEIEIFSLRHPEDGHFQDAIARVRARVRYLPIPGRRAADLWSTLGTAGAAIPGLWERLKDAVADEPRHFDPALRIALAAHEAGITHLHAHFATEASSVARLAAYLADVSHSFTAHAKDIFHDDVSEDAIAAKMSAADAVVTVSDYNERHLRGIVDDPSIRLARVYNGLELERFPYSEPLRRPPRVLAVGRLVEKKGFVDLIEACALLRARGVRFYCDIIGAGELESELGARIAERRLSDSVDLLGPRPQAEVFERLRQAAVLAVPCVRGRDGNRDGLPTVLLESMALGTPCVSTDVTGIPEVLRAGETGLAVAQRDPAGLADALAKLLEDAGLRVRLAAAARQLIERRFDVDRNVEALLRLFTRREAAALERAS